MSVVIITGSAGLIGSEATNFFAGLGFDVVGIENDMRREFFGAEASTAWNQQRLKRATVPSCQLRHSQPGCRGGPVC